MRRRRAAGQALLLALVVLLLASMAAALVGASLSLEQRMHLREVEGMRLRAILDGAVTTAVARLAENDSYRGHAEDWAGGRIAVEARPSGQATAELWVVARFRDRRAAGRGVVAMISAKGPKVIRWQEMPPDRAPASLRRRLRGE